MYFFLLTSIYFKNFPKPKWIHSLSLPAIALFLKVYYTFPIDLIGTLYFNYIQSDLIFIAMWDFFFTNCVCVWINYCSICFSPWIKKDRKPRYFHSCWNNPLGFTCSVKTELAKEWHRNGADCMTGSPFAWNIQGSTRLWRLESVK